MLYQIVGYSKYMFLIQIKNIKSIWKFNDYNNEEHIYMDTFLILPKSGSKENIQCPCILSGIVRMVRWLAQKTVLSCYPSLISWALASY